MKTKKTAKQHRDDKKLIIIGQNIRKYRLLKGYSQSELAFECGEKEWSQISRMERGLVNFHISYLFEIADALGIPSKELLP